MNDYANLTAARPEWLAYVERCAQARSTRGLPSLESELGPGRWKVKGDRLKCIGNDCLRYRLHWRSDTGTHTMIGTYDAARVKGEPPMVVIEEKYRFAVEQCREQNGSAVGIPGLQHLFGPGKYKVESCGLRQDGYETLILYWSREGVRQRVRLGSFGLDGNLLARTKPRKAEKRGELDLGRDELGRRVIKVVTEAHRSDHYCVAIEYEIVRGKRMPKPVHDRVAQMFQVCVVS